MLVFSLPKHQSKHWSDGGLLLKQEVSYLIIQIISVRRAGSETVLMADLHQNVLAGWWRRLVLMVRWGHLSVVEDAYVLCSQCGFALPVKWIYWSVLSAVGRSSNTTALSANPPVCWLRSSVWQACILVEERSRCSCYSVTQMQRCRTLYHIVYKTHANLDLLNNIVMRPDSWSPGVEKRQKECSSCAQIWP